MTVYQLQNTIEIIESNLARLDQYLRVLCAYEPQALTTSHVLSA